MRKKHIIYCLALATVLTTGAVSCQKEPQAEYVSVASEPTVFSCDVREMSTSTKSSYIASDFDDSKVTSVVLAAYEHSSGLLQDKAYFASGFTAMSLNLVRGTQYDIHAFVNMGDVRGSLPDSRTALLSSFAYSVPSYSDVNTKGIPMGGTLSYTAGSTSSRSIAVRRLFAKVTLNVSLEYDGGPSGSVSIKELKVSNANRLLKPFSDSRIDASNRHVIPSDDYQSVSSTATAGAVFYVPENLQGTITGATTSHDKNPDVIEAINSKRDILTYVQVKVEAQSAYYSGTVNYRSYIGSNALDNFDVRGNESYIWNMTLTEDGLVHDDWKIDNGVTDNRYLQFTVNPVLVEAGDEISWSDILSTNLIWGDIEKSYTGTTLYAALPTQQGFTVKPDATEGASMKATFSPASNPSPSLTDDTDFVVVERYIRFDEDEYSTRPRHGVDSGVEYGNSHSGAEVGLGGLNSGNGVKWTVTPPAGLPHTDSPSTNYLDYSYDSATDNVTWTPSKLAVPGDYTITCQTVDGKHSDSATLRVEDTRWINTDKAYASHRRDTAMMYSTYILNPRTWKIGLAWGDLSLSDSNPKNESDPNRYHFAGLSRYSDWSDHIGYRLVGTDASRYLTLESAGPDELTYSLNSRTPIGDYRCEVYWIDSYDETLGDYTIKDYAELHVIKSSSTRRLRIPSSLNLIVGSGTDITANFSPVSPYSDVRWVIDSGESVIAIEKTDYQTAHITALQSGTATLHAVAADGSNLESNTCTVTVHAGAITGISIPSFLYLTAGSGTDISATVQPENAITKRVTWVLDTGDSVIAIEGTGDLTAHIDALQAGNATLHAVAADGSGVVSNTCTVSVVAPGTTFDLEVRPASASIAVGANVTLTSYLHTYINGVDDGGVQVNATYTVESGSGIISVDRYTGKVTGLAAGTGTVRCYYFAPDGNYYTKFVQITVGGSAPTISYHLTLLPESASITVGEEKTFKAYLHTVTNGVDDGGVQVNASWSIVSGNGYIALNSSTGKVTGTAAGTAVIKASYSTGGNTYNAQASVIVGEEPDFNVDPGDGGGSGNDGQDY